MSDFRLDFIIPRKQYALRRALNSRKSEKFWTGVYDRLRSRQNKIRISGNFSLLDLLDFNLEKTIELEKCSKKKLLLKSYIAIQSCILRGLDIYKRDSEQERDTSKIEISGEEEIVWYLKN